MSGDHTCSYFCERPECIRAQRDELREEIELQRALVKEAQEMAIELSGVEMLDRELFQAMYDLLESEPRADVCCDRLESMLSERLKGKNG
jgi:hypothetical protein